MSQKKIDFVGFLTNADASILQVSLDHGFRIEALSQIEAMKLLSAIRDVTPSEAGRILFIQYPCLHPEEKQVYAIRNSIEVDSGTEEGKMFNVVSRFDNKLFHGYLHPCIRLMRLFKEGDLRMPLKFYYTVERGKPRSFISGWGGKFVTPELYHLESSELPNLQMFISNTRLPFKRAFLQLAFENFELSYEVSNPGLSFLTLMISLETLLNPGEHELRYRISRNTAVLLGDDGEESSTIFSEIKRLYDKRSKVVHTGDSKIIDKDALRKLRNYVRESIKKIYLMKNSKGEILELLNSQGFGEIVKP